MAPGLVAPPVAGGCGVTLRARLLIGLLAMVVAVIAALAVVARTQHRYTLRQLDRQLLAALPVAPRLVRAELGGPGAGPLRPLDSFLADLYVGYLDADGVLVTVAAPLDDPGLKPALPSRLVPGRALTVPAGGGRASQLRVVASTVRPTLTFVVGVSTERVDAASRRLLLAGGAAGAAVVAVLALVVSWVLRLGLQPIRVMTDTAEALAAGSTSRRAPRFAEGTEADRLGQALNRLVDTTQAAESRLRRFLADASHELRTPLTTLAGYTNLYRSGGLRSPEELDDAMRRISQEALRMNHLVEDLFLLAELDEGHPLQRQDVDLGRVVSDLASDLRAVHPLRSIDVVLSGVPGSGDLVVSGDEHRLTQAVAAYTANAVRYTPPEAPLRLWVARQGDRVRVEVTDRGPGIGAEHLEHLFERFYRVEAARTRALGGSGLGLAMVAAIVEAHDGHYGVHSTAGSGSTFWFDVPAGGHSG